ncbi:bifunctional histidinol-phosphatase/imidazoleglycerol-phosphate dehydratase HisB [Candidatus Blochmannia vicinus (nom. nud.)]|uniref:Histidine biosynthesis bifunctional protein HisB n=1 Tax=Candidatus Blochmannia vicinus (nom. nud.) TaxID=251540 RepID=A0A9Q8TXA0_9ENTR|nr:bifunctional histidinol-phosphatase/imidazoleglycerol-phosphate dehydratase HisB [Candidatus Blochmannia vicinus]URJ28303.1 bifunctional histidinol-phosphatase/imidazoleglycerol-phosphate dehydratase HisB [Candidatus Blochmannia vicinus]URJ30421.1 bifunctional histidinol-phosphatase/imidazoleglycerol-phosphate dehydratase HisB [Candidatus Blochmannia vicinus]
MCHKILFIDRDGTLINEPKDNFQVDSLDKFSLEPHVISALIALKNIGFEFVIVTNQNGLGSVSFPKAKFDEIHYLMIKIFQSQGIKFNQILICPHFPEEKCSCRKPKTALVNYWLIDNRLNKFNSYVIGDRDTDMMLATNMGIQGIRYHHINFGWKKIKNYLIQHYRSAHIHRTTEETNIDIKIWLDQNDKSYIDTGINFFNHMLQQIAIHAGLRMNIIAKGDLYIDDHHTVEDTALTLGEALNVALHNKCGIKRFGFTLPMDESIAQCILDLSGRTYFHYQAKYNFQKIGDLSTEMIEHFFRSLSSKMSCALHLQATGNNDHHKAESLFKSFGRALRQAIYIDNNNIPSSKGTLL